MTLRSGVLRRYEPRPKKKKTESNKIKLAVQLVRCLHSGVQYNMLTYGDEHEDGWETEGQGEAGVVSHALHPAQVGRRHRGDHAAHVDRGVEHREIGCLGKFCILHQPSNVMGG